MSAEKSIESSEAIAEHLESQFFGGEPKETEPAPEPQTDEQAVEAALDAQDAPAPPVDDGIELDWDTGPRKFTKAELKDLAKKGFEVDHVKQTSAQVAEATHRMVQSAEAVMQLAPAVEAIRERGRMLAANIQHLDARIGELKDDPIARYDLEIQRRQAVEMFQGLAQQEGQVSGHLAKAMQARQHAEMQAELPNVYKSLPHWQDPVKRAADQRFIADYLTEHGYTSAEINGITKARYLRTALDAAKYHAIVKNRTTKRAQAALPPVITPGSPQTSGQKAQGERLDFNRQLKAAKTDGAKAQVILKKLERQF